MELIIGCNVNFEEVSGLVGSVKEAISYDANSFMFYTGPNQSFASTPIDEKLVLLGYKLMDEKGIKKENVIVHAPFIINLANNTDSRKWDFYIKFLSEEMSRCEKLGVNKLILHPGSAVNVSREDALLNISYCLDIVLKKHPKMMILLEYMSGRGTECGKSIEELKTIINNVTLNNQLGVCLDTCHMHDAGIDLKNIDDFLKEFDKSIGIDKIKCIHINDSMNDIGLSKDRHENIGYGKIGFDVLLNVIYREEFTNIPKILETPFFNRREENSYPLYKEEIEMIRKKEFKDFKKAN